MMTENMKVVLVKLFIEVCYWGCSCCLEEKYDKYSLKVNKKSNWGRLTVTGGHGDGAARTQQKEYPGWQCDQSVAGRGDHDDRTFTSSVESTGRQERGSHAQLVAAMRVASLAWPWMALAGWACQHESAKTCYSPPVAKPARRYANIWRVQIKFRSRFGLHSISFEQPDAGGHFPSSPTPHLLHPSVDLQPTALCCSLTTVHGFICVNMC